MSTTDPEASGPGPAARNVAGSETVLVRLSGPDRSGITSELMGILAATGASIQDVEQVVIRRHLTLGMIVVIPDGSDVLKDLLLFAWERGLAIDFDVVDPAPTQHRRVDVVTVLASQVTPAQLGAVSAAVVKSAGNIDRIVRMSRYPVTSFELRVTGADVEQLRTLLLAASAEHLFDVALQPEGLGRRAKRLVVLDVDSTLIRNEVIELLADEHGCGELVHRITERAMAGELDFEAALRERVRLLAGLDMAALERARSRLQLTPGARTFVRTLRRLGYRIALVSGGFTEFTDGLAADLDVHHVYANRLEIVDGRLTGELSGPIVDRARKAALLREVAAAEGIPLEQTVAVGDGANDLDMLATAGLGVAFNARPMVREAADTSVNVPYLDAILFILGVSREEVEAADESDPDLPQL